MAQRTKDELVAGLDQVREAPSDAGTLDLIVRRPAVGEREELDVAELSKADGLVGDNWLARGSRQTDDGSAEIGRQLTVMSTRAITLFAGGPSGWAEAGDQLYVDLDISETNLPAGSRLQIGTALLEVSALPHTGCSKFAERFGIDAARFVNTPEGRELRLRGLNAVVVEPGRIRAGDPITKVAAAVTA